MKMGSNNFTKSHQVDATLAFEWHHCDPSHNRLVHTRVYCARFNGNCNGFAPPFFCYRCLSPHHAPLMKGHVVLLLSRRVSIEYSSIEYRASSTKRIIASCSSHHLLSSLPHCLLSTSTVSTHLFSMT